MTDLRFRLQFKFSMLILQEQDEQDEEYRENINISLGSCDFIHLDKLMMTVA